MRFLFLVAVVTTLGVGLAPPVAAQVSLGVRAGINATTLVGDDIEHGTGRIGFVLGGFIAVPLVAQLSLQPEILFSQKGAHYRFSDAAEGEAGTPIVTHALAYLDVPLLLQVAFRAADALVVGVHAGPQVSFRLDEAARPDDLGTGEARDVDLGLVLGGDASARLAGGIHQVGVGVRYSTGLTRLREAASVRNRAVSISVFYRF